MLRTTRMTPVTWGRRASRIATAVLVGTLSLGAVAPAAAVVPSTVAATASIDDEFPEDAAAPTREEPMPAPEESTPIPDAPAPDSAATESASGGEEPVVPEVDEDAPAASGDEVDITTEEVHTPAISPRATTPYLFGKGSTYGITDPREGTVLGYDGRPQDLGRTNDHFVYYEIPKTTTTTTTTTTFNTGYQETVSMSKYTTGTLGSFGLAINAAGQVYAWGGNAAGQLGNGTSGSANSSNPFPAPVLNMPANTRFVQVSAGGKHALALSEFGDIYAWGGTNNNGQLGQGNTTLISGGQSRPLKVNVPGVKFKQISAGQDYSLAVTTTGVVYAWGYNSFGQTTGVGGNGTPTPISGLSNVAMVSAGMVHAGAVTANGQLYMWGYQFNGRLGNGLTTGSGGVQRIGSAMTWKQVSAGSASTWAVTTGGQLYAWGYNGSYQLGLGDTTQRTAPTSVGLSGVKQVAGNAEAALAVTTSGAVYAAGTNTYAQLGTAATLTRWTSIVASGATEVQLGFEGAAYKSSTNTMTWGMGQQTGRGLANYTAPGPIGSVSGSPAVPWVTETTTSQTTVTMDDATAIGSIIAFGNPTTQPETPAGWQRAKNIRVVTIGGVRYLRGDVPPHNAGMVDVYLRWNDGKDQWGDTGDYKYTIALKIETIPEVQWKTKLVDVVTTFAEPLEAPYVGSTKIDFNIPELEFTPQILTSPNASVKNIDFATGTAAVKVGLRDQNQPPNNGAQWLYYASSIAKVGTVDVHRTEPLGLIQFKALPEVHLWKTGVSVSGAEVGMTGSSWSLHPESTTAPGTPDTSKAVAGFDREVANANTINPNRKQGWFTAALEPGTYWLFETKAPAGFSLMAKPLQFTVDENGAVALGSGKGGYTRATNDWNTSQAKVDTIVIRDPGATTLPSSGSDSWMWLTYAGLVALVVAFLLIVRRARPSRSDD